MREQCNSEALIRMIDEQSSELSAIVVGTGFGNRIHVPALRAAGFHVEALVGRDAERTERRAKRLGIPRALTSLDEALALPGLDAVTIATPPTTHAAVVRAVAAAGKHVLCEKPFALDADEARAMLGAVQAANLVHRVGFEFRWSTDRALLARALADGAIGEPRFASFTSYVPLLADPDSKMPEWWWDAERGGGWLAASGSHFVDALRIWFGEIEAVNTTLTLVSDRTGVAEDSFTLAFRSRSGVQGVLQQTGGAWGPFASFTRIAGRSGSLWTDGKATWLADRDGTRALPVPSELELPAPPARSGSRHDQYSHLELGPYIRLCESFRDEILGVTPTGAMDSRTPPPPDFRDGLASMRILDAARKSASEQRWVEVKE